MRTARVAIVTVFVAMLAACGGGTATSTPTSTSEPAATIPVSATTPVVAAALTATAPAATGSAAVASPTTLTRPASGLLSVSGDERKVLGTVTGPCSISRAANGQDLPDPVCTPGAIAERVTQNNLQSTICTVGYTATVRPSTSITTPLKQKTAAAYGLTYTPAVQEYDHLIPLELGGANDVRNLWTEPPTSPTQKSVNNAKDPVENKLHDLVCAGRVTLADAQERIAADWTTALIGL